MISPTEATHASPPVATAKLAELSDATTPASRSPSRGPLVTTSMNTEDIRPRIGSGVTVWLIAGRHPALAEPPPPATAGRPAATHSDGTGPAAAIASPHTQTAP